MVGTYTSNSGLPASYLSAAWLRARGWAVALLPHLGTVQDDAAEAALAAAIARRGHPSLIGTAVSPVEPEPSAVWRMPPAAEPLGRFLNAHT